MIRFSSLGLAGFALGASLLLGSVATAVAGDDPGYYNPPKASGLCVACHGIEGNSLKPNYPKLTGQESHYIAVQLSDFRAGRRKDPNMNAVAKNLSDADILDAAAYFASRRRPSSSVSPSPRANLASPNKASVCIVCHEALKSGQHATPWILGQQHDYVTKQLRDFRDGRRSDPDRVMSAIAANLTDADIEQIAELLQPRGALLSEQLPAPEDDSIR